MQAAGRPIALALVIIGTVPASACERDGAPAPTIPTGPSAAGTSPGPSPSLSPLPSPISSLVDVSFVDVETGRARKLPRAIRAVDGADHFQVSPAGTRIAFIASDGIHVARLNGEHLRRLTSVPGATAPSWSPDGRTLVASDGSQLFLITVRTGRVTALGRPHRQVWHPNYSPDGRTVLFTRRTGGDLELWTIPVTGGPGGLLLELPVAGVGAAFGSVGPDGRIAFRRTNYDGTAFTEMTEAGVWIARADGSDPARSIAWVGSMSQIEPQALWPAWSPDGTRIAFEWLYQRGIRVLDVTTGSLVTLGAGIHPSWADDHTLIVEGYHSHASG